jgi:hypothetical protein
VVTGQGDAAPVQNGTILPGATVDERVASVMIPKIQLDQASLSASLDMLRQRTSKLSGGAAVNFVVQGEALGAKPVNLNASDVPFFAALRYVCYQADAKFAVDKYAIVISAANPPPALNK